jgi:hypothetical protein
LDAGRGIQGDAVTDEEKRDVARDEFDNCCCNYAIDLHEKVDALTKQLDAATRELTQLRAENERLCLPVANEEWPKTWEGHPRPSITRSAVNSLIASRWFSFAAGAERKGSDGSKETDH